MARPGRGWRHWTCPPTGANCSAWVLPRPEMSGRQALSALAPVCGPSRCTAADQHIRTAARARPARCGSDPDQHDCHRTGAVAPVPPGVPGAVLHDAVTLAEVDLSVIELQPDLPGQEADQVEAGRTVHPVLA